MSKKIEKNRQSQNDCKREKDREKMFIAKILQLHKSIYMQKCFYVLMSSFDSFHLTCPFHRTTNTEKRKRNRKSGVFRFYEIF